jgi:hypothetical protein
MIGPYQLDIESMERFELETIPQEGAGLYSKLVQGEWSVILFLSSRCIVLT